MVDPYNPDELLVCPYDPAHRVARKRMQGHLVKCRKNYNTSQYKTCPFNAQHVIPKPEFHFHIANCPNKDRIELDVLDEGQGLYKQKGNTTMPETDWIPPDTSETWDDDNVCYRPKVVDQLFDKKEPISVKKKGSMIDETSSKKPKTDFVHQEIRMPHTPSSTNPQIYQFTVSGPLDGAPKGKGRGRGIRAADFTTLPPPPGFTASGITPLAGRGIIHSAPNGGMTAPAGAGIIRGQPNMDQQIPITKTRLTNGIGRGVPVHQEATPTPSLVSSVDQPKTEEDLATKMSKKLRSLKKTLSQIELTEEKQKSGGVLNNDQIIKLQSKQSVIDQIKTIQDLLS